MMKKSISIVLAVLLLLSVTACGEKRPEGVLISTENTELMNSNGVYFTAEWNTVSLNSSDKEAFPELSASLAQWSADIQADVQKNIDWCKENVDEETPYLPYTMTLTCEKLRMDETVVSFMEKTELYLGGPHPNTSIQGYAFSVKDGTPLTLVDMITDANHEEECRQATVYTLENHECVSEFYEDWHDLAREYLADLSTVDWLLYDDCVCIIIPDYTIAPHAVGNIEVELSFAEFYEMFRADYK